jgi:hypothetical protein
MICRYVIMTPVCSVPVTNRHYMMYGANGKQIPFTLTLYTSVYNLYTKPLKRINF